MSNAIIKQQADSPIVADNIFQVRLGAGSFILGALAGTLVTAAVARLTAKGEATPKPATPRGWPINFSHRGGAKVVPEDTIEGFREGFATGGGVVECDVRASAEGAIVVIHDAVVDRTTDGTGPVAEKTVPELRRLDAGYRFSPDGGSTFPWRARGVKIPTLEALYEAFPDAPFNIEIKGRRSGIEEAVFGHIEAAGAMERTLVVSDNQGTISQSQPGEGRHCRLNRGALALLDSSRAASRRLVRPALPGSATSGEIQRRRACRHSPIRTRGARPWPSGRCLDDRRRTGNATAAELRHRRDHDRPARRVGSCAERR
jgi:Glycerophosphoryl diester phosphodiesterase family